MFGFRNRAAHPTPPDPAPTPPVSLHGEVFAPARPGSGPGELDGRKVMARLVGVVARVPRYLKLGWRLLQDPTVSGKGKAALGGGLAYAVSPIDPLPGIIPMIGQLDDLAILLLSVRTALRSCPPEVADVHLRAAGLTWETLERDLVTLRATAIWVARGGGKLAMRIGKALVRAAVNRIGVPAVAPSVSGGRS
jgi:uncharacterized membrane protein YkvA (DUF1232 family)